LQAQALGDLGVRAMVLADPPTWEQAFVTNREAVGDGLPDKVRRQVPVADPVRWTLVGTS
jgi:hypothetical protein